MNLLGWKSFVSLILTISVIWANFAHVSGQDEEGIYRIGTGIADITGPPTGVLSGYLTRILRSSGIFTRLYARSFLVESLTTKDVAVVYVTCDLAMFDHGLKVEIIKKLKAKHGDKFTEKNVLISATHTHSGPSGYMQYQSYLKFESYGFKPANFWAIVDGVVESIEMAETSAVNGKIYMSKGTFDRNANRRTEAYDLNPDVGDYPTNTDQEMIMLKLVDNDGQTPIGQFNWWPVLPISFNGGYNPLVSSDNRGYAAQLFDTDVKKQGATKFVSGFGSSNQGDVTPFDPMLGQQTVRVRIEHTREKAMEQYTKAKELFEADTATLVTGPINYVHQHVNATEQYITVEDRNVTLCKAAIGLSFLNANPALAPIYDLLFKASGEVKDCQSPKQIAIPTGELADPWDWAPSIFSIQILQIGNVDLVALPGDFTTMAGRRVRKAVEAALGPEHQVVLAGLANNYISYVTTPEEYALQLYEGGATIYGPNTLPVFVKLYGEMATALLNDIELEAGPAPPHFISRLSGLPEKPDNSLYSRPFGAPITQPARWVTYGQEMKATFVGGRPRNNSLRGGSFFIVEKQQEDGTWQTVRTDADLDTTIVPNSPTASFICRFYWNPFLRQSEVYWKVPGNNDEELLGTYRVRIFGHSEVTSAVLGNKLRPYTGISDTFEVIPQP